MNTTKITCPKCGCEIDVNDILAHQINEQFQKKYNSDVAQLNKDYENKLAQIETEKADLEEKQKLIDERVNELVKGKLKSQETDIEKRLREKIETENSERIGALEKEVTEKSAQVKELNKARAEIERIKREKSELKDALEAEAEKKLNDQIAAEKIKIRKQEQDKNELKIKELEKKIEDQKKLTDEMARRQDQGSIQLQGEVQELGMEAWLISQFPLDAIAEIKKGERGADCIHTVNTRHRQNCGVIYYESKRTKEFGGTWIEKFKNDIREKGANIGVLVSEVYPKGMQRMGLVDGIWVCSYEEFKGLCHVLRDSLIQISNAITSQENKGEKMTMLYDFLTSNEFRLQVEAIVEGFTQMQADLNAEKRSIQGHWKKREKQIQKVLLNTNHMYNSIRGIAGNAVQSIKVLELPEAIETDSEVEL